ncbi:MAG: 5'-nucleotidase C-terminal domain-containing protein [Gemmatimonadota bacterium]|nr:MAG: 5'-nucleotidase C-terminal domain-containing protein [Gemmatimonadota bacterium]
MRIVANALAGIALSLTVSAAVAQDSAHVVVAATTDVHGRAYHWDYLGDREAPWGLTRVATVVDSLRVEYPGQVILLDAGDLVQGSPFATFFAREREVDPHPVIDALNAVGYDVTTPGNHDFDFGTAVYGRVVASAAFPIVSGNIYRMPRDTFAFQPHVMLQRSGVRIGVAGFTTPGVMVWNQERVANRLVVRRILPEADRTLRRFAAEGADLRIVIAHTGMDAPSSYDTLNVGAENVAAQLARLPVAPHLVIVGHSHREFADSVIGETHFVQPRQWGLSLAVVHIWLVREASDDVAQSHAVGGFRVARIASQLIPLSGVPAHAVVTQRLTRAHQSVRLWVATPLAQAEGNWSAHYARANDTPIIDFVNQVQLDATGADLSATAAFDVTARFDRDIFLRDVAALYPYENTLKVVQIDGVMLKEYLEEAASYYATFEPGQPVLNDSVPGYDFDIVSGVDYVIDLMQPVGSRIRQLTWEGRLVQAADTFTLALSDYRQAGGRGYGIVTRLPAVYEGGDNIRDLLIRRIRQAQLLRDSDYFQQSWGIVPAEAARAVRDAYGPPAGDTIAGQLALSDSAVTVFTVRDTVRPAPPPPDPAIARLKFPLELDTGESPLGRLVADAFRNGARTHFALVMNASLHGGLPAGQVTLGDIAAVLPTDDALVRVAVTGDVLYEVLEQVLREGTPTAHVSGLEVWYDPGRQAGERVRRLRFPDGSTVRGNEVYSLALVASVAAGTQGIMTLQGVPPGATGVTSVAAVAAYLQRLGQPVDIPRDTRIHTSQ